MVRRDEHAIRELSLLTGARSEVADQSDVITDRSDVTSDGAPVLIDAWNIATEDSAALFAWTDAATAPSAGHGALTIDPREWVMCR
jgi:hypothetical protein